MAHTKKTRPIGIDLFAGAGGLTLGFEQAGFDVVAAVEVDPIHAATHRFNFPNCSVLPASIDSLTGDDIRNTAGIGHRTVDVVFGGAPCQGFSLIGQRAFDDPRNRLVKEFLRIIVELAPNYFVFENVRGLTVGRHRNFLEELIAEFGSIGYEVHLPWQILNAASFGVPQDRRRLFLIGAKRKLPVPEYPQPVTRAPGIRDDSLSPPPTCEDALADLPDAEDYAELLSGDSVRADSWGKPSKYARMLRCEGRGAWEFGYRRRWHRRVLTSSMRTEHTEISRRRFEETEPGTVEPISRFFKLHPHGVSNTLRAGTDSARGAFTSPRPIHYIFLRCITVREMARLHGFPDWFRFHQTKWHGARQIGNAVPPPLAKAVADEIMKALGQAPSCPDATLDLGPENLLYMNMSQAAAYWGVPVPISRRDRRSGARKRKQHQIEIQRLMAMGASVV